VSLIDFSPLWLTLRIALIATPILFVLCLPLAFGLTRSRPWLRYPIQALVNLPLVLPPTVLGFYLLLAFSPERLPGSWLKAVFNLTLAFSQPGLVIASVLFSLPFMINPMIAGFESLPRALSEEAVMDGAAPWQILYHVLIPNMRPSLIAGLVLTFCHTLGEFGVALMVGGKIPGKTVLASMAVYDEVESLHYNVAHIYSGILCLFAFICLSALFVLNRKGHRAF
jgi:molybdate transport system permease protein